MKNWPAAILAIACLAAVTVLAALHVDTAVIMSAIVSVAVPIIGAMIYGGVQEIKVQTNGNTSRLMDLVEQQLEHIVDKPAVQKIVDEVLGRDRTVTTAPPVALPAPDTPTAVRVSPLADPTGIPVDASMVPHILSGTVPPELIAAAQERAAARTAAAGTPAPVTP